MAYTDIDDPTIYFNTKLYSGNSSTQSITGVGFQPDMTWIKARSGTHGTENHNLFDSVRGANYFLIPNGTTASTEDTNSLTAFDSDGFSLGTRTDVNGSAEYVAWNWLAGGSASSNSDGDVTASVSANTTAGFSIVKFTSSSSSGAMTVGHGLGATPQVVIVKDIGATGNWQVYFEGIGTANQQYLKLNATDAVTNYSGLWGAGMTSSVIGIGVGVAVDASESDIAYCFAEKKGYSKFGSYTGNGNADGAFVYTGFKPAWVLLKQTDSAGSWNLYDNKRNGFNVDNDLILTDASNAEANATFIDFLSNGFKIRDTDDDRNASNGTYVFMAFAESPFVNSNGVPNNAR
jgi:hypothetical protein